MPTPLARRLVSAITVLAAAAFSTAARADDAPRKLAHSVFFTLKDRSPEARDRFVASCQKYLTGHQGAVSFSLSTIADDVSEGDVSVRDFDVALLVVFATKADEQAYLKHPRHLKFVEENRAGFAKVRVFDSYLVSP